MEAFKFLFTPHVYMLLIWFVLIAIAIMYQKDALVIGLVVVFAVGSIWYFDRRGDANGLQVQSEQSGERGAVAAENDTNRIAGPVEEYQDNTWDKNNMETKISKVPDVIDIQGLLTDLPGHSWA